MYQISTSEIDGNYDSWMLEIKQMQQFYETKQNQANPTVYPPWQSKKNDAIYDDAMHIL